VEQVAAEIVVKMEQKQKHTHPSSLDTKISNMMTLPTATNPDLYTDSHKDFCFYEWFWTYSQVLSNLTWMPG